MQSPKDWSPGLEGGVALLEKNQQLITNELAKIWDFMIITNHFRGIYRVYLTWIKPDRKMSTSDRLDLESLGSWLTMSKKLPRHGGQAFNLQEEVSTVVGT